MKTKKGAPIGKSAKSGVMYIRGMNRDLKDQFHGFCARKGMSMREVIEEFMRVFVKELGREPDSKTVRSVLKKVRAA